MALANHFQLQFWNDPHRLNRASIQQRLRWQHSCSVPGHIGDPTDRGQPKRFRKWSKLPEKAHRLYWRTHKNHGKAAN